MSNILVRARKAGALFCVAPILLLGLQADGLAQTAPQPPAKAETPKKPVAAQKPTVKPKPRAAAKPRTVKPVELSASAPVMLAPAAAPAALPPEPIVNAQESLQLGRHLEEAGKSREAIIAYERAANAAQGAPSGVAAKRLGEIFDNGLGGTPRDYETALRWYDKARVAGETVARPGVYRTVRGVN